MNDKHSAPFALIADDPQHPVIVRFENQIDDDTQRLKNQVISTLVLLIHQMLEL